MPLFTVYKLDTTYDIINIKTLHFTSINLGRNIMNILIVEDEQNIAQLIQAGLDKAGYQWEHAKDGKIAADQIENQNFDLVLLDIMLPEINGYELMEYIEPLGIPVIFITAKSTTENKIKGLRMGADDYIVKPFEVNELLARIDTVLRRYNKSQGVFYLNNTTIDINKRKVSQGEIDINLTPMEFELLVYLIRNKNTALFRETILERVWGITEMSDSRTLDLHIQRLRKKLNWHGYIRTVYKVGYCLEVSS